MCQPGTACCGCDTASSGLGLAVGVVAAAAVVSVTASLITSILTAILVVVLSLAATAGALLAVILHRTRALSARHLRERLSQPSSPADRRAVAPARQALAPGRPPAPAIALAAAPALAAPALAAPARPAALTSGSAALPAGQAAVSLALPAGTSPFPAGLDQAACQQAVAFVWAMLAIPVRTREAADRVSREGNSAGGGPNAAGGPLKQSDLRRS